MSSVLRKSTVAGAFTSPTPKLPPAQETIEPVTTIEEDAGDVRRRKRKRLSAGGRQSTILSGIQSALKKRLGE